MEDNLVNDSWDDIDLSDLTDEGAAEETEDAADAAAENEGAEEPEANQPTETDAQEQDTFKLNYMGQEKSVTREEVVPLAQKGMDYDRVREKLDAANNTLKDYEQVKTDLANRNEQIQWLEEIAQLQGVSLDELIVNTHAQAMARKTGKALEVCRGIVENKRKERELQNRKAQMEHKDSAPGEEAKRNEDISAFTKAYPELANDPKKVPQEVWDAVGRGESLLTAYQQYEIKQLRNELDRQKAESEKQKQKELNKSRSVGSQSTKGTQTVDPFDAAWYDGT